MDDLERELKQTFLVEATAFLEEAERCFLDLEQAAEDPSIIEKIFRLAHNFKGSAGAVGFDKLASLAHTFESLLVKVKNHDIPTDRGIIDLLLRTNDVLNKSINMLKENLEADIGGESIIAELKARMEAPKMTPEQAAFAALPEPTPPSAPAGGDLFAQFEKMLGTVPPPTPEPMAMPEAPKAAAPVTAPATPATPASKGAPVDNSVRVSFDKLDNLINFVGEVVILQTVLSQQKSQIASPLLQKTIGQLAKITKDLQDVAMSLRMLPIKQVFSKLQRIVRDSSKALGKDIELHIAGEDTEVDKSILEQLSDPLVHLIRNAIDHGVETPEGRVAANKPLTGHVWLRAFQRGRHLVIEIKDDGRGLDPEKLRNKAVEKGLISNTKVMSNEEAYKIIFLPGFSTKQEVTDISGRGVGMDVVKSNIEALKGDIQIETAIGTGTTFRILLPLTLAIIEGMVVRVVDEHFILPMANVHESVRLQKESLHSLSGVGEVINLRGENMPLYRMNNLLGRKVKSDVINDENIAIIVRDNQKPYAIVVDDIIGQQQVVIKRLGTEIQNIRGVSGGAILGDGKAALILDLHEVVPAKHHSLGEKRVAHG